jgi:hypothetical protein
MEVAAGLEPAKTGFADQRLDRFGIATKPTLNPGKPCQTYTRVVPKPVPKLPSKRLFTPIFSFANY